MYKFFTSLNTNISLAWTCAQSSLRTETGSKRLFVYLKRTNYGCNICLSIVFAEYSGRFWKANKKATCENKIYLCFSFDYIFVNNTSFFIARTIENVKYLCS